MSTNSAALQAEIDRKAAAILQIMDDAAWAALTIDQKVELLRTLLK